MEWTSNSWGEEGRLIEQAKEELQLLEAQHPNRFEYLKLELKSFISLLESQNFILLSNVPTSSIATTQASSTNKKRKKSNYVIKASKQKLQGGDCDGFHKGKDRVDLVIERAQTCLHKIQQFKSSFCS